MGQKIVGRNGKEPVPAHDNIFCTPSTPASDVIAIANSCNQDIRVEDSDDEYDQRPPPPLPSQQRKIRELSKEDSQEQTSERPFSATNKGKITGVEKDFRINETAGHVILRNKSKKESQSSEGDDYSHCMENQVPGRDNLRGRESETEGRSRSRDRDRSALQATVAGFMDVTFETACETTRRPAWRG